MPVVLGTVILENFKLFLFVIMSQSRRIAFHTGAAKHAIEQYECGLTIKFANSKR